MEETAPQVAPPELRPYQVKLVEEIRQAYRRGVRSVLAVAPTGAGKTICFAHIARQASLKGTSTCILVHRDTLLYQTSKALMLYGIDHGIIAPGYPRTDHRIQIASVQSLARRLDHYRFGFLVIDEAHHATANTWKRILAAYPEAYVLGVTATPCRSDGQGLGSMFQVLILGPSTKQLTALGYLSPATIYAPAKPLDLSMVSTLAGDYNTHELADAMDRPTITGNAVAEYTKLAQGQPAVVFCVSIKHAESTAAIFQAAGYRSMAIHGDLPRASIQEALQDLAAGRLQVLAQCDLVNEGLDTPAIACGILLRPTQSLGLYIQQVGRCLRPFPGKSQAVILDHAGNCLRHGLPDEPQSWTLEGRKRRRGEHVVPAVRQCPQCYACHHPAPTCPQCGHTYKVADMTPPQVDGTLTKVDLAAIQAARKAARVEVGRARTLEALLAIAAKRGYNPQWARIIYAQRQRYGR